MVMVMATVMVCRLDESNIFIAVSRPHHDGQRARVQVVGLVAVVGSSGGRASTVVSTHDGNGPASVLDRFKTARMRMVMVMA